MIEDFDCIGRITDVPMTIVGKAGLEAKNIGELLAWLKEKQKDVTYAHAGIGSASHLCALLFMNATKVEMTAVSYRGTGPAMNDLLGGQFDMMCDQTTGTTNQIKEGKIKGYAATTARGSRCCPSCRRSTSPASRASRSRPGTPCGRPRACPAEVTDKLVAALQVALKDQKVIERFAEPRHRAGGADQATPEALKTQLAAEVAKWGPVIKAAGAKGGN